MKCNSEFWGTVIIPSVNLKSNCANISIALDYLSSCVAISLHETHIKRWWSLNNFQIHTFSPLSSFLAYFIIYFIFSIYIFRYTLLTIIFILFFLSKNISLCTTKIKKKNLAFTWIIFYFALALLLLLLYFMCKFTIDFFFSFLFHLQFNCKTALSFEE